MTRPPADTRGVAEQGRTALLRPAQAPDAQDTERNETLGVWVPGCEGLGHKALDNQDAPSLQGHPQSCHSGPFTDWPPEGGRHSKCLRCRFSSLLLGKNILGAESQCPTGAGGGFHGWRAGTTLPDSVYKDTTGRTSLWTQGCQQGCSVLPAPALVPPGEGAPRRGGAAAHLLHATLPSVKQGVPHGAPHGDIPTLPPEPLDFPTPVNIILGNTQSLGVLGGGGLLTCFRETNWRQNTKGAACELPSAETHVETGSQTLSTVVAENAGAQRGKRKRLLSSTPGEQRCKDLGYIFLHFLNSYK